MTTKVHCESSLGSFDECSAAHKRPSTLRPSHVTWAVSPPVLGSYRLQPPSPFIIITQPESWYSFTVPRRVEGWVDLGTAGKVHTALAQGCKSQWLCDKHNCPQRDSIPGPRALQSDMLPLDHCDLQSCHLKKCHKDIYTLYMMKVESRQQEPPAKKAKLGELSAAPKTIQLGIQQMTK